MRFVALGVAAAAFIAVAAVSVFDEPTNAGAAAKPVLWTHGAFPAAAQRLALIIRPAQGKEPSDEWVDEPNIAVRPGDPVRVVVVNYTRRPHTFTIPALGISELIRPARAHHPIRTTFTFTVKRFGTFKWYCAVPCAGFMGGTVYAIVGEPAA